MKKNSFHLRLFDSVDWRWFSWTRFAKMRSSGKSMCTYEKWTCFLIEQGFWQLRCLQCCCFINTEFRLHGITDHTFSSLLIGLQKRIFWTNILTCWKFKLGHHIFLFLEFSCLIFEMLPNANGVGLRLN